MEDQNELLDDNWVDGPCYKKDVKRKLPIQKIPEYICGMINSFQKKTQTQTPTDNIELEEPDGRTIEDGGSHAPPGRQLSRRSTNSQVTETKKPLLSRDNPPRHPIQLMVCMIMTTLCLHCTVLQIKREKHLSSRT